MYLVHAFTAAQTFVCMADLKNYLKKIDKCMYENSYMHSVIFFVVVIN